jgi:hypothetical protein
MMLPWMTARPPCDGNPVELPGRQQNGHLFARQDCPLPKCKLTKRSGKTCRGDALPDKLVWPRHEVFAPAMDVHA